jgi:hypothetical protein
MHCHNITSAMEKEEVSLFMKLECGLIVLSLGQSQGMMALLSRSRKNENSKGEVRKCSSQCCYMLAFFSSRGIARSTHKSRRHPKVSAVVKVQFVCTVVEVTMHIPLELLTSSPTCTVCESLCTIYVPDGLPTGHPDAQPDQGLHAHDSNCAGNPVFWKVV